MKLESKILDDMLNASNLTANQLIELGFKFWISKEYTEYSTKHHFMDVIQTKVLTEDTIILGTEEHFIKHKLK